MVIVNGSKAMPCANMPKTIGLVLAGGESSRMGQDKAYLECNHINLVSHMACILSDAGISDIKTSHPDFIKDVIPQCGPLGGIYSVIESLKLDDCRLCIVPVDMPNLRAEDIEELVKHQADKLITAVHYDNYRLPLILTVTPALKRQIYNIIKDPSQNNSIKNLLSKLNLETLARPEGHNEIFVNINTRIEWLEYVEEQM